VCVCICVFKGSKEDKMPLLGIAFCAFRFKSSLPLLFMHFN